MEARPFDHHLMCKTLKQRVDSPRVLGNPCLCQCRILICIYIYINTYVWYINQYVHIYILCIQLCISLDYPHINVYLVYLYLNRMGWSCHAGPGPFTHLTSLAAWTLDVDLNPNCRDWFKLGEYSGTPQKCYKFHFLNYEKMMIQLIQQCKTWDFELQDQWLLTTQRIVFFTSCDDQTRVQVAKPQSERARCELHHGSYIGIMSKKP